MPAMVLSRAAAARARKPPDFCELVEELLRWWMRRLALVDDGDEIEVVPEWEWERVGDSGPSEDGDVEMEMEGESCGAGEGSWGDGSELRGGGAEAATWTGRDDCVDCETAAIYRRAG